MASSPALTFADLKKKIAAGDFAPVYLLYGEEAYFTDLLVDDFTAVVPEEERDFNLYNLYGPETSAEAVIEVCRRYPMMSALQVVILRQAQEMRADRLNRLHSYVANPTPTTVLVIVCRGEREARGKDLLAAMRKHGGVMFESKRISDRNLPGAVADLAHQKGLSVDQKALSMLVDHIGADLSRLDNEISKLALVLGPKAMVTPEAIERNVGISKDYNNFELVDAVNARNAARCFAIVRYFASNPNSNPTAVTVSTLFNHFSNLLVYHYTADKSPTGYCDALGLRQPWQLRKYEQGARSFNVRQTIEIISAIRQMDTRSKGIGSRQNQFDLLNDLVYRILTARGEIVI